MTKLSKFAGRFRKNWTILPNDVICVILSYLTFQELAKCSEINLVMMKIVDSVLHNIDTIKEKIPVGCIQYIVKKCHQLKSPPDISGAKKIQTDSMCLLLRRWPNELYLNWVMTDAGVISKFMQTLQLSDFLDLQHLSLKIEEISVFQSTPMLFHYMHLKSLNIEAEGCDLETVLLKLNCRFWDVNEFYLRGDVTNLGSLMMYAPSVSSKTTVINTNDNIQSLCIGNEQGLRYLLNSIENVELCNIIKFCCFPPKKCLISDLFIQAVDESHKSKFNGTWKTDRLNADMIESLLEKSMKVQCGVFQCEINQINALQRKYADKINVLSIL